VSALIEVIFLLSTAAANVYLFSEVKIANMAVESSYLTAGQGRPRQRFSALASARCSTLMSSTSEIEVSECPLRTLGRIHLILRKQPAYVDHLIRPFILNGGTFLSRGLRFKIGA
jgi:hypothetical protein